MYQPEYATEETAVTDSFYQRYAATIFTYARQHTLTREDAEDVVVETFLAILETPKFLLLAEKEQIAWLWRVARNKVIDSYRRSNIRRSIPLEQISEAIYEDESWGPEQTILRREEEAQVFNLLKRLPPGHQEVLQLRFGHGLRSAEIASIVGKQDAAVRTIISRAMNLLRKIYTER